jgi:ABC-2 type transport system permease protein
MWAILVKEMIQMRRDRVTFAMILTIPIMQLIVFGYAINNDPKHLPTAVQIEDNSSISRTLLSALQNSEYFSFIETTNGETKSDDLIRQGKVSFILTIPAGFSERLIRGEHPQILLEADATDPVATANAIAKFQLIIEHALAQEFKGPLSYLASQESATEVIILPHYNPEGVTAFNIVPGLVGVILTMTMVMITSMAMTREVERGTMENLLAMPVRPYQVMIGKITPYILVGAVQTLIILIASHFLFTVPFIGSLWILSIGVGLFILANLALGFTFSTLAKTQMQAMQLTIFFFLPSILLSGFMFPFHGMPEWAQVIGEGLPLTHFLRIIRGVMLKDTDFNDLAPEFMAIAIFLVVVGTLAIKRYRQTLD